MPSTPTPDPAPAGASAQVSRRAPSPARRGRSAVCRAAPAFGGLRLVEVPGGWPPYDCEVHGPACPAAREVSVTEPMRRPGPGRIRRRRAARSFSRLQHRPSGPRGGPRGRVVQAVRPGDRRDPGRRPVAAATRSLDDRTGPGSHHPAHPDAIRGPAAQDPAHRDVAAGGARGGDDRRAQFRAAVPRAGATPGAAARPPARARTARPSGPMALHRDRDRLADAVRPGASCFPAIREGVSRDGRAGSDHCGSLHPWTGVQRSAILGAAAPDTCSDSHQVPREQPRRGRVDHRVPQDPCHRGCGDTQSRTP